ncbi:MAG: DUF2887 domain-containing protein [Oscillatoriales cyanobacterium SM2_1_8]|nr:DUF2887 domain-containing protein [Oscillatoriales cyanobacterium SM2_1_8]
MRTDTLFYGLLQACPELIFELTAIPMVPGYGLTAVEVKEKSFRFDGVLMPSTSAPADAPLWFIEVQFQKRGDFYRDFFTKAALYVKQFAVERPCRLLAIFPSRDLDSAIPPFYQPQVEAGWVYRVYLNEWAGEASWGGELLKLVVAPEPEMRGRVQALQAQAPALAATVRAQMLDWLETLLVYRYPNQSREEIAQMFALGDLRDTRVYQEALNEGMALGTKQGIELGQKKGEQEGEARLVLRLLTHRFGSLSIPQRRRILTLSVTQLEELGEALLDWRTRTELTDWLRGL